ncbi:MAG: ribosome-associated translation inhibitor RaiA [Alphaproteobacteria bacterium]|nr:ribosome-associated translation inhibitor RaiA [Alphaproteobacteria bacterium]
MTIQITGRHIDISDSFRQSVESGLEELTSKHNISPLETSITLTKQGPSFAADINAHLARGLNLRSRGEGGGAYSCFQNALDKLRTRVRRHKNWVDDHHKHHDVHFEEVSSYVMNADTPTNGYVAEKELSPAIIAETKTDVPTLSAGEAVTRFDLSEEGAYVFRNIKNNAINVVYRRSDGNIGWIDLHCKN